MTGRDYRLGATISKISEDTSLWKSEKGVVKIQKNTLAIPITLEDEEKGYIFHGHGKLLLDTIVETEKGAIGRYLDGRVTAVVGTHTHVQTADERILPGGTAYITDAGMTGPHESVLGRRIDRVLHRFTTGMYAKFDVASGDVRLCGVIIDDPETGRANSIERIAITADE